MAGERDGTTTRDEAWSPDAREKTVNLDLPGYRDFVLLARGGESIVYRARQEALDRLVAVKVLTRTFGDAGGAGPGGNADDEENRRLFQRELEITMRLGQAHPNIVTVLDTRLTGAGEPCIVMEYYELGSLHDRLRAHGRLPASAVVSAGTVVADALAYAHGQGVLHRDVKPQNILVLPTSYVLADFGLARHIDAERSASLERFSYRHASPQALDGELPSAADDVYSLASTLFTLLDGRPPFATDDPAADTALAYLRRARTEEPRTITNPDVPPGLLEIIRTGLARRREDRLPDAASLRDALAAVATEARVWAPGSTVRSTVDGQRPVAPPPAAEKAEASRSGSEKASEWGRLPVARSAVEHLQRPSDPDAAIEPTGRRPEDPPPPPAPAKPAWPRLVVLSGLALLLGGILGLVGTWISSPDQTDPNGPNAGRTVPTFTGSLVPSGGLVEDQSIAPQITAIDNRGTSIEIRWTDRSGGKATFVIVEVNSVGGTPVRQVDPGETSVVIEGLNPAQPRYCYQILALTDKARGISLPQCTEPRSS